jgi:hypothetical protein
MKSLRILRAVTAIAVFVIAFGVYLRTLTPTVGFVDSGELTLAAWSLGNAHPPGFPLYLMLTRLFMLLPLGSVAVRANAASAFFAAVSCAMLTLAIGEILLTPWRRRAVTPAAPAAKRKKGAPAPAPVAVAAEEPVPSPIIVALVSAFGGLTLAFSRTLWAYATVAEVYALNTALLVTIFWLMLAWRRRELAGDVRATRWLYAAAIVFGLALGVHHVTIGINLLAVGALVFLTAGVPFFRSKKLLIAAVLAIVALVAVYAYLPLAASHKPFMNWGDPSSVSGIVDHITAKQYRLYIKTDNPSTNSFLDYVVRDLGPTWLPLALLLGIAGLVQLFRRDRAVAIFLLLVIAADFGWTLIYPIVNDQDAYALPAFVALAIAAAIGAWTIASLVRGREAIIAAALLAIPTLGCATAWKYRDRSRFEVPRNYVADAVAPMKPNALLITGDWELYSPLMYFTEVERLRPDVRAIETGMLLRSWYLDSLERRYPQLMKSVAPEVAAYRPWLKRWETLTSAEWEADPANRIELYRRVNALLSALITRNIGSGVYATVDFALSQDESVLPTIKQLAAGYDVVPRSVVVEYLPGHGVRELRTLPLHTAGLNDGSTAYQPDDVVVTEVTPVYRGAFLMRARYLAVSKRVDEAVAAYQEALVLDPESSMIQRELAAVQSQQR